MAFICFVGQCFIAKRSDDAAKIGPYASHHTGSGTGCAIEPFIRILAYQATSFSFGFTTHHAVVEITWT